MLPLRWSTYEEGRYGYKTFLIGPRCFRADITGVLEPRYAYPRHEKLRNSLGVLAASLEVDQTTQRTAKPDGLLGSSTTPTYMDGVQETTLYRRSERGPFENTSLVSVPCFHQHTVCVINEVWRLVLSLK